MDTMADSLKNKLAKIGSLGIPDQEKQNAENGGEKVDAQEIE